MAPIHDAAQDGDMDKLAKLIDQDLEVVHSLSCGSTSRGWSPLSFASYYQHPQVVSYLLDHGARINHQTSICKSTALHLACQDEDSRADMVELLLG